MKALVVGLALMLVAPLTLDDCGGTECPRCPRSYSTTANTCGHLIGYSFTEIGSGSKDGCCVAEGCTAGPCVWQGNFAALNNTGGQKKIKITRGGDTKTCNSVNDGSYCTMSFDDGTTYPNLVADCPNGTTDVVIDVLNLDDTAYCSRTVRFKCGQCPGTPQ